MQGQRKAKSVGFLCIELVRMKFDVMLEQFRLNILIPVQSIIFVIKGNNSCVADCVTNFNVDMFAGVFEPICSNLL